MTRWPHCAALPVSVVVFPRRRERIDRRSRNAKRPADAHGLDAASPDGVADGLVVDAEDGGELFR